MDRALAELIKRGSDRFEFVVFSVTLAPELRPFVEWRAIPVPRRPIPLKFVLFFLLAGVQLARERFDLVCTVGAIVPNHADVVSVHYCHTGFYRATGRLAPSDGTVARRLNTSLLRSLSLAAERWCYRNGRANMLAAVSEGLAGELTRAFPDVSVVVVPNGVDLDRFAPAAEARTRIRADMQIAAAGVAVLFVGGDWDRKGLGVAIEALAQARAAGARDLRLWVVGRGNERQYSSLARSRGVGDSVTFFGPRTDTERFYQSSDIFVLPTHYEALPLVVLEALAAGLPVVATPVHGVAELFNGRRPGILVERTPDSVGEALAELARNPDIREEMGRAGRALASEYTWERSVERMLDLYRAMLDPERHKAMRP